MSRLELIKNSMKQAGIDGLYITSPENHLYACGFNNPDGQVLITKNKSYVFADFRYIEAAKRECDTNFEVVMPSGKMSTNALLKEYTEENEVKTLGFEESFMNVKEHTTLSELLPSCTLTPSDSILSKLRITKTEDEVEKIIKAQRIAEAALEELIPRITYDMTEIDVAAELEYLMKKKGAHGFSFETIAVSGSNSSSPHGVPRNVKLEKGFLTLDFGALIDGYHSDMTRTLVIGKADEDMKRLYNTVLEAQNAVLEVITEGSSNREMDKIARDIIYGAGYEGCFGHGLGHGVGLLIHEAPNLSPAVAPEIILHKGEVVTVEPGIYIEGKYGCRIEDMVYITEGGAINLTKAPKEIIEI